MNEDGTASASPVWPLPILRRYTSDFYGHSRIFGSFEFFKALRNKAQTSREIFSTKLYHKAIPLKLWTNWINCDVSMRDESNRGICIIQIPRFDWIILCGWTTPKQTRNYNKKSSNKEKIQWNNPEKICYTLSSKV